MPRGSTPEARRARNIASERWDKDNTRQVKFKFNLRTDADILSHLDAQPNIQGYVKTLIRNDIKEASTMISVALSNRDCIFDSSEFPTLEEALTFARGRGGIYVVQLSRGEDPGAVFSYDSDADEFSRFDGWEWHTIPAADIASYI